MEWPSGNLGEVQRFQETRLDPMPPTMLGVWNILWQLRNRLLKHEVLCVLEKVQGWAGKGGDGEESGGPANAHRSFKFGQQFGWCQMALAAAGLRTDEVAPQSWQGEFIAKVKGEGKAPHKRRLKAAAKELFPSEKVTLETADALLLAEWCRRKHS